jgi:uncharacterized protein (DUF1330 family)
MTVYTVAQIAITDPERYSQYEAGFRPVFAAYGGEVIDVDDHPEALEGELSGNRCVILRFPDRRGLMAWYRSHEYLRLAKERWASSDGSIVMIQALA